MTDNAITSDSDEQEGSSESSAEFSDGHGSEKSDFVPGLNAGKLASSDSLDSGEKSAGNEPGSINMTDTKLSTQQQQHTGRASNEINAEGRGDSEPTNLFSG